MRIGSLSTLVTLGDHMRRYALAHAFVEHKVLPDKFAFKAFFPHLSGIVDHTAFELKHIFEAPVP